MVNENNGLFRILLIPSFTSVVFPVPIGPLIAIADPTDLGLVINSYLFDIVSRISVY